MSKRKVKFPSHGRSLHSGATMSESFAPSAMDVFRRANMELHAIKVSTPILIIIQRLATDEKFRRSVERLF